MMGGLRSMVAMVRRLGLGALLLALPAALAAAPAPAPLLRVGTAARVPTIDGVLAPGEWDAAASGSGLLDLGTSRLAAVQPRFWLTCDAEALYFAAVVPIPAGRPPKAEARARDGQVYQDDSVELILDPGRTKSHYVQFILNGHGALYDARDQDGQWNATHARSAGALGATQWSVEFAVPFADLGVAAPAEGAQWGGNICLSDTRGQGIQATWAPVASGFREPARFGDLVFTRGQDVAALHHLEALLAGRGAIELLSSAATPIEGSLRILTAGAKPDVVVDAHQSAPGRCVLPFVLPDTTPDQPAAEYHCEVRAVQAGKPCLALAFDLGLVPPLQVQVEAALQSRQVVVTIAPGPTFVHPEEAVCRVAIGPAGHAPTKESAAALSAAVPTTLTFAAGDVPAGQVAIGVTVTDRVGKVLFQQTREFDDPLNPWWVSDRTGAEDVVLPPYEPLSAEADTVRSWGRRYRLGPCLLPAVVETAGASVLAAPVAFRVRSGGRDWSWSGGAPVLAESAAHRVTWRGQAACEGLELNGTAMVEVDGMLRVDLTLTPKGEAAIDELTLEIPLRAEYATYLYHFPGRWGSVANAGALPVAGFRDGFKPYLWLGDNERGFAWFCESEQNWLPEDRQDAVTVDREGDRVMLRLRLLQGERVDAPLSYTFGFQATPVKAPEKTVWDYRPFHISSYGIQDKPAGAPGWLDYPARGNLRGDAGSAEMWVTLPVDSDPAGPGKGDTTIPNVTFFWVDVDPQTNGGLFWCGPAQAVRIWSRVDDRVLVALDAPVTWRRDEWHHVAFSWGEELCLYIDGELRARKPWQGLMPKGLDQARLLVGKSAPPARIDEIRVSRIARAPELAGQPYGPDADTLLLDHLDVAATRLSDAALSSAVALGGAGRVAGTALGTEGRHGRALQLRPSGAQYSLLDQLADSGVRTVCFHAQWSWMGYPMVPPGLEKDLRELVAACHRKGIQILLYGSPLTPDQAPEWELYHKDFLIEPLHWPYRYAGTHLAPACCWQSPYRNLWLARQARLIDEYDIDGFYLDGSEWPLWCTNRRHGCGYVRRDGKIAPTCNLLGTRDYMRRLYTLCRTRKADAQLNIHNSTVMVIPTLGWGTSSWDGEQLGSLSWDQGGVVEKMAYALDVLPLDAFRAEFMGRQWGVPAEFLCYERPYTTPQILTVTLLHDVLVRPHLQHLPRLSAIWQLGDRFGRREAEFLPYWRNGDLLRTSPDTIKVSAYRHPAGRLLLLLANLATSQADAHIRFDPAALGLRGPGLQARDALETTPVPLDQAGIRLRMEPFSYRYLWLE